MWVFAVPLSLIPPLRIAEVEVILEAALVNTVGGVGVVGLGVGGAGAAVLKVPMDLPPDVGLLTFTDQK